MYYLGIINYGSADDTVIAIDEIVKAKDIDTFKEVLIQDYINHCKEDLQLYDPDMAVNINISGTKIYLNVKDKFSKDELHYQYGYLLYKED